MKVLLVDDEIDFCDVFKDFLVKKGHEVIVATSGKEAIEKLNAQKPNLVFLDIRMPRMSGIEILKEIRKIDKELKIIMVTVLDDEQTAQKAIELGANDYTTKPISFDYIEKILVTAEVDLRSKNKIS